MLYSEYTKKINKLAAFFAALKKYRIIIFAVLAVLLIGSATLMATRGLVFDSVACPSQIEYGEELSYRAGAFMTDVTYEYCAVGSTEWSETAPRYAGKYMVRAVSERVGGAKSYGRVYEFTIAPKAVDISIASSVLFGEKPECSAKLAYDDTFTVAAFEYADPSKTSTLVKADVNSIVAFNADGEDVTSSYSFRSEYGDISFVPREIEITVPDVEGVYDGNPLKSAAWELTGGTLANGDGIVTVFDKSQTDVGSIENTPTVTVTRAVLNSDGIDVTANYRIKQKIGVLTVTKRDVLVKTGDGTHVYDDTAFSCPEFELGEDYTLVVSDALVAAVSSSITDVGETENKILFEVHDADGKDVTYNYNIVVELGTLTVTKRDITVKTASDSKVYDGMPLDHGGYVLEKTLASGHSLKVGELPEITNAGTLTNDFAVTVLGVDGSTDKSANYNISYEYGTLEVTKRRLDIVTPSHEWVYDGNAHHYAEGYTQTGLVKGHELSVTSYTEITDVLRDKTDIVGKPNELTFKVMGGGVDLTDNYEIFTECGFIKITPREITALTASAEWIYDGLWHGAPTATDRDGLLVKGHSLTVTDNVAVKYVKLDDNGEVKTYDNTAVIGVVDGDGNVMTANYTVALACGKLKILKRNIEFVAGSAQKVYDDTELKNTDNSNYEITSGKDVGLALGDTVAALRFEDNGITDAGTIPNNIVKSSIKIVWGENADDVTYNYNVIVKNGALTVTKRPVTIVTASQTWEYDGKEHINKTWKVKEGSLEFVSDHTLTVTGWTGMKNVKRDPVDPKIILGESNVLKLDLIGTNAKEDNYDITQESGKLKITPRPITIQTATNSWVYDAQLHEDGDYEITKGSLADNQYMAQAERVYITDVIRDKIDDTEVGKKVNDISFEIFDKNDTATPRTVLTYNYDVTYVYGTLTVTPRTVRITTPTKTWEYDDDTHCEIGVIVQAFDDKTNEGIVARHRYSATSWVKVHDVMRDEKGAVVGKDNVITHDIHDRDTGAKVSLNYNLVYTYGKLTITPRKITVQAKDVSRVFNGIKDEDYIQTRGDYEITVGSLVAEHNDSYEVIFTGSDYVNTKYSAHIAVPEYDGLGIYVGTYNYSIEKMRIYRNVVRGGNTTLNEEVTDNYDITFDVKAAAHTVTKRPITLCSYGSEDDERYYDGDKSYWIYDGTAKYYHHFGSLVYPDNDGNFHPDKGAVFVWDEVDERYKLLHNYIADEDSWASVTDAGEYDNTFTVKIYERSGELGLQNGKDITDNYDITYQYGILDVLPRPVTLQTATREWIYDGESHSDDSWNVKEGSLGLVFDHAIKAGSVAPSVKDVKDGKVQNRFGLVLFNADANSKVPVKPSNYSFKIEYGTVEILPRPVAIKTGSAKKMYDGTPLVCRTYEFVLTDGYYPLVDGHTEFVTFDPDSQITNVGTVKNTASIDIRDASDNYVKDNYDCTVIEGELTVTMREFTVTTDDRSKVYDGTPLYGGGAKVVPDDSDDVGLLDGHTAVFSDTDVSSITNVWESGADNAVVVQKIIDAFGNDVTENYTPVYVYGELTVMPRKIVVQTASNTWEYDGKEHSDKGFKIVDGKLVDGHVITVAKCATIKEVGSVDNILEFEIFDGENDVTGNYEAVSDVGTLTVTEAVDPPDPPDPPDEPTVVLRVKADKDGLLYLRYTSYGEYKGTTDWASTGGAYNGQAISYDGKKYSVNYLASIIMKNAGIEAVNAEIENVAYEYVLPYFTSLDSGPAYIGDIAPNESAKKYSLVAYPYAYASDNGQKVSGTTLGIYAALEAAYRDYVYNTYLTVPESTAAYMQGIIDRRKFVRDDPAIISKIADFMQSATTAKYNPDYNRELDKQPDVAVAFLDKYKEGVCRHYATAATMLFRTLGIPARYTVGAVGNAKSGEWVDVMNTNLHAWVEVYIDGLGWVYAEVTGGNGEGGGNGDGSGDGNGDGSGASDVDDSGEIGGGELIDADGEPTPFLTIMSDRSGSVYLRQKSFGDYNFKAWGSAAEYGAYIDIDGKDYGMNYLTGIKLGSVMTAFKLDVKPANGVNRYYLPYYLSVDGDGHAVQKSDTVNTDSGGDYGAYYYAYDYKTDLGRTLGSASFGEYAAYERAYRNYVYENYTAIPNSTLEFMKKIIAEKGFADLSVPDKVAAVANYISHAATYNLEYDKALDGEADIAVAFLDKYKEGICQHYATAATLMYRALGIPARYTIGFVGSVASGKWTEIYANNAHAWTEVYIDGLGWVQIEVTGGGSGGTGGGTGGEQKTPISVKPVDVVKEYTGDEIFAEQAVEDAEGNTLAEYLGKGYSYTARIAGSRTDYGTSESTIIEVRMFDPNGNDVSDQFMFDYRPGKIVVTKKQIKVYAPTYQKMYDGTPLKFEELFEGEYGYYWDALPDGVADIVIDMGLYDGITEVGSVTATELIDIFAELGAITVIGADGSDVTENYTVVFVEGGLTIEPRALRITAGSAEKKYDGVALTCDDYDITFGTLVDGHTLEVVMKGEIVDIGMADNTVDKVIVRDTDGNDVTDCYEIMTVQGLLIVS